MQKFSARLVVLFLGITFAAAAQNAPDPSKCFNDMLVNHYDFSKRQSLLLAALAITSQDNYEDAKKSLSLMAFVPSVGLFSGDYGDYKTKRDRLFQYNKLNLNEYQEILLNSTWIGDRGYDVIEKCIDAQSFSGDGFHYRVETASPTLVAIQFLWSSPSHNMNAVHILDSQLFNGSVEGVPDHKLFPKGGGSLEVGKATVPIFVKREAATDPIFITVTTDLDRQPGVIRIDPLPSPKPLLWRQFVLETDQQGHVIQHSPAYEIRADNWTLTQKPSDGYEFAQLPTCTQDANYPLSNVHILSSDWDKPNNTFTCKGTMNANPRFIDINYTQGRWQEQCIMNCELGPQ